MVVWGTFAQRDCEGNTQQGIILLDAFAARLDFPALKMKAVEMQELWRPDYLLIENKGTGMPLIQELPKLKAGIFAQEANRIAGATRSCERMQSLTYLRAAWCGRPSDCGGWSRWAMRCRHSRTAKTTTYTTPRSTVCYASAKAG
jgi:hypothetical protein